MGSRCPDVATEPPPLPTTIAMKLFAFFALIATAVAAPATFYSSGAWPSVYSGAAISPSWYSGAYSHAGFPYTYTAGSPITYTAGAPITPYPAGAPITYTAGSSIAYSAINPAIIPKYYSETEGTRHIVN